MKHRMINCTTTAVETLYLKRDWRQVFMNIKNIRIPSEMPIDLDESVRDQPESVWENMVRDGIEVHENESFLMDIQKQPETIIEYPRDIFLVNQAIKRKISKNTGVIIMSEKSAKVTSLKYKWPGKLVWNSQFNWNLFFTKKGRDISLVPNNALVITDLYLFDNLAQGIQNISDMLEEILPASFDFDYHILIVTDVSQNFSTTAEKVVQKLQNIKNTLKRPYPLVMEVLFINRHDGKPKTEEEKALFSLYSASHNRRVYSNSFIIYSEHGYNAVKDYFGELQARWDQKVELQCIYHGVDNKHEDTNEYPINFIDNYLSYLTEITDKSLKVGRYFINGVEGHPKNIINRLIRY